MDDVAKQLGQQVRDLRERQRLSQQALAQRAGIATSTLSEIEAGRYTPNLKVVIALAEALHVPIEALLRVQPSSLQMLLRAVETPANVGALQQWAERCYRYAQVEKLAGVEVTPAPVYAPPRSLEEAEQLALQERERLRLGTQPIANVIQVVEDNGLRVVGADLPADDVDGALFHDSTLGAFALINRSISPARQRFTLAHEYAHYLIHREQPVQVERRVLRSDEWKEKIANRFAAAFLMPASDIADALRVFSLPRRKGSLPLYAWILLRRRYRVSKNALAWRLHSLGWISDQEREWALQDGQILYEAERAIFGDIELPQPLPSFTDRAMALLLHAYAREETTASFVAETLQKPLALILDYLHLARQPVAAIAEYRLQPKHDVGGSSFDDSPASLDG